jgi:hypothetical protein
MKEAVSPAWKAKAYPVLYLLIAILVVLQLPPTANAVFVAYALLWLIPNRRIEENYTN